MYVITNFINLNSLKTRRLVFEATFMYKLLSGEIDCSELLHKIGLKISSFNSRHNLLIAILQTKQNYFTYSPVCRLPTMCNQIKNFNVKKLYL
jgi:hypothetical protein